MHAHFYAGQPSLQKFSNLSRDWLNHRTNFVWETLERITHSSKQILSPQKGAGHGERGKRNPGS